MATERKTQKILTTLSKNVHITTLLPRPGNKRKKTQARCNTTREQRRQYVPTRRAAQSENSKNIPQNRNNEKSKPQPRLHACKMSELTQDTSRHDKKRLKSHRPHGRGKKT